MSKSIRYIVRYSDGNEGYSYLIYLPVDDEWKTSKHAMRVFKTVDEAVKAARIAGFGPFDILRVDGTETVYSGE